MNQTGLYTIRDPIYGFITLDELEKEIIDHSCFQRLRRIQQLGLSSMVYPGTTHTRFEHSLGIMHLSTLMYDKITNDPKYNEMLKKRGYHKEGLERNRHLIRLSALLHDIGHSPFSHGAEELMPYDQRTKKRLRHENYSSYIIKNILKDTIEQNEYNNRNCNIKADEVAALIEFDPNFVSDDYFLKEIISSQLDADRGDYLLRDSHHAGVKYGVYDYLRLLDTFALGEDPETGNLVIGVDRGGLHVAEALVIARYQMFNQVYFHKTRRAFDFHLKEALKNILPKKTFPKIKEIKKYLKLDDYLIWEKIKRSNNKHSKAIFERKPIKMVYEIKNLKNYQNLIKYLKKLKSSHIWFHIDYPTSSPWYKVYDEIFIIDKENGKIEPLSTQSELIKNLTKQFNIHRVYVNPEDKEKAKNYLH